MAATAAAAVKAAVQAQEYEAVVTMAMVSVAKETAVPAAKQAAARLAVVADLVEETVAAAVS